MTDRTDNFTRADTTNAIGTPSDGGSAWVQQSGTWGIASNQGYESSGSVNHAMCVLESSVANVDVVCTFQGTVSSDFGIIARSADVNNHLAIYHDTSGFEMYKRVAGSLTQLGSSVAYTPVAGDTFKFSVSSANDLNGYINGVLKINVNDSTGSANTLHGMDVNFNNLTRFTLFSITAQAVPDAIGSANITSSAGRFIGWTT